MMRRDGIRPLPGICWYPAKRTGSAREFKVAPRIVYSSLTGNLSGAFFSALQFYVRCGIFSLQDGCSAVFVLYCFRTEAEKEMLRVKRRTLIRTLYDLGSRLETVAERAIAALVHRIIRRR